MVKSPLISIILPVHNGRRYLKEAVESCLNQSHPNIELIIVDDGSIDDSVLIAQEYKSRDKRVKIISNGRNLTLPVSLNIGHEEALGDFITWTSDDNIYQKDAISTLYTTMLQQKADIVYSDYLLIDEDGKLIGRTILKPIEYLLFSGVIGACFLYNKEVYFRNNGYNESLSLVEDYDFWIRALKHSSFFKIENPGFYYYRYHPTSLTIRMKSDLNLKEQFYKNLEKVYENAFLDIPLNNKEFLKKVLVRHNIYGSQVLSEILNKKKIFKDLNQISECFQSFTAKKLRMLFLMDLLEVIMKNPEKQNLKNLILLHQEAKWDLLKLPINRYLAICKKCFF